MITTKKNKDSKILKAIMQENNYWKKLKIATAEFRSSSLKTLNEMKLSKLRKKQNKLPQRRKEIHFNRSKEQFKENKRDFRH